MDTLKILVISDLHTSGHDENDKITKMSYKFIKTLIDYLKNLEYKINIIVCAGDIGSKGCEDSFNKGWEYIQNLQKELAIPILLCVPGNHDHGSRTGGPKENIKYAKPPFPFDSEIGINHFLAQDWFFDDSHEFFNVLYVNSSAFHGYVKDGDGEIQTGYGEIKIAAIDRIEKKIAESNKKKFFNILICHHNIYPMGHINNTEDTQAMKNAVLLLNKLSESSLLPWLIIHGHKHFPEIKSYTAEVNAIILSAGSLSSCIYSNNSTNQFHILDIDLDKTKQHGTVYGTFETHENLHQWGYSKQDEHLPFKGGFGSTLTAIDIANEIKKKLGTDLIMNNDNLQEVKELLQYCIPKKRRDIINYLDSEFQIKMIIPLLSDDIEIGVKNKE